MAQDGHPHLEAIEIDPVSLGSVSRDLEHERQVAVFDLLERNHFEPQDGGPGPFRLTIGVQDGRLALDISGPGHQRRHLLSLSPFRGLIKDYFMVCESYYQAVRQASPSQIEALDMGRRGLHNEGSEKLRERLAGKVTLDFETARRLFTLICVLHRRS